MLAGNDDPAVVLDERRGWNGCDLEAIQHYDRSGDVIGGPE